MRSLFFIFSFLYLLQLQHSGINENILVELKLKIDRVPFKVAPGGCGFVALYLNDKLPGSQIINFYTSGMPRMHFMVKYKGYYGDMYGFTKSPVWLLFNSRVVTRSFLSAQLADTGKWNKSFNRSDTVFIKNALK